ncbi:Transposase, Ptta/En/Spm, plant [Cucumis melo var. makuwa]|uniref:Transposase, Ptta/En/Spm, plant n=1 Tax=Cucumis melo var. makuwa TaxID=1194695 RepID=A0A5A7UMZ7_CUCMM|nr:Transposase, Ptta/En/Spm, plant [Cucumis melo var. makuwa]
MSLLNNKHQMLEFQSQPTSEGSQPLSKDKICEIVLGKRSGYLKSLGRGPKPKSQKTGRSSSSSYSQEMHSREITELRSSLECSQLKIEEQKSKLEEPK